MWMKIHYKEPDHSKWEIIQKKIAQRLQRAINSPKVERVEFKRETISETPPK